ncbi:serine/threonine-protein kinase [Montanilutibacter psychrotolerans]|uniref:serine/threonine-protein kinase n=1 Tax=Montanilutibacter psychrotolerans TaxID=1327343 RepID=UPI00167FF8FB|nr:serine/threonine-protein kinase [Lysobacter psychrotolerans]
MSLFDPYSELPPDALKRALAQLQLNDPDACRELIGLLAADERTHSFASPLRWFAERTPKATGGYEVHADGNLFGPWRTEGVLGIGGMGVIYAVRRADGLYEREAALKTIRAEVSSPQLLDAFRIERNLLARLDHPAIVSLFDAGVGDDGQPWITMQRIVGEHIDAWCDSRHASLRQRVGLFVDVCDAIVHAHDHGVLHQDIKPSNVLVTDDGKIKLLDFGLSALLSRSENDIPQRIGASMPYAAPEIFSDAPPSVAIDVHALGVMLYRLLCAGWPRPCGSVIGAAPVEGFPTPPSTVALRATAVETRNRGATTARSLSVSLCGDMDVIALRCVANDPVARYASVAELRNDVKAWLERRPVAARNGGGGYRVGRFLRRHVLAAIVASTLTVAAVATAWVVLAQQREARAQGENDRALAELFRISVLAASQNARSGGREDVRPLLHHAEHRLRSAAGGDQPQFLARGLASLAGAYYEQSNYAQSERLWLEVLAQCPDDPMLRARTFDSLASLANKRVDTKGMMRFSRQGIDALEDRDDKESTMLRLSLQFSLARSYWLRDDTSQALQIIDRAIRVARGQGSDHEAQLAGLVRQRGVMLSSIGRVVEADRDLTEAMNRMATSTPAVRISIMQSLAVLRMQAGHSDSGRELAERAMGESLRVYGDDHVETARAWLVMAKLWRAAGTNSRRARVALHRAEALIANHLGSGHPMMQGILEERADLEFSLHHRAAAIAYARRAEALAIKTYGENSSRARTCTARRSRFEAPPAVGANEA